MKKFGLAILLFPVLVFGQATTAYHRLNQVLQRAPQGGATAQVVPYATVYVTNTSSGTAAAIYSDPGLSIAIAGATVTADSNGNYGYYIALQSCVNERITYPGGGSITYTNVCSNTSPGVTSFSAPSASWPSWLTPTVTNSTTTPSLAVAAGAIPYSAFTVLAANQVLGALTATVPSGLALPSCSGATNALIWTTGTGFGCNTINAGAGTVTTTGTPAAGNLSAFSGATSITNGNLSGDVTTSGTLATTVVKVNGGSIPVSAKAVGSNGSGQLTAASLQGADTFLLTSGTVSGTGVIFCTDSSGGATTVGCPGYVTNPMSSVGDMIVGGTSGTPTRLAAGATNSHFTISSGSPAWVGTDTYYLNQTACTPAATTDATCPATQSVSQPDANYMAWVQLYSSAGASIGAVVTAKGSTILSYNVYCTYNCSAYGTVTADVYIHHN